MSSLIPDPIRDALQAQADHLSNLVGLANITVAVGVALEGVEIIHDIANWGKKKRRRKREHIELKEIAEVFPTGELRQSTELHADEPRWVKRLLRIGLIIVVIGVVAEWRCGAKLEDTHNAIHQHDLEKIAAADEKAGDAATSAKTAHDEADAVKLEADGIQKRLDAASQQLGIVEHTVRLQGPRWELLDDHRDEFVKILQPFAGQKAFILLCGRKETIPEEQARLVQYAVSFLNTAPPSGAGWKAYVKSWNSCPAVGPTEGGGNEIVISTSASVAVKAAAKALNDELNKIEIRTTTDAVDPNTPTAVLHYWFGADSAGELALKNPDSICLAIGPNPMSKQHK